MRFWLFASAVICLIVTSSSADEVVVDEAKRLSGVWKCVSSIDRGTPLDDAIVKKLRVIIDAKKVTFRWNETKDVPFTYTIDSRRSPKQIDMTAASDDELFKGRICKGIYKIDGDTLTICMNDLGIGDRPVAFSSEMRSTHSLYVLKRANP